MSSGWTPTCDSAHSWQLYSATLLGNQTVGVMTWYRTRSHYPDIGANQSLPYCINAECQAVSYKYQFDKWLVWLDREQFSCLQDPHSTGSATAPSRHRPGPHPTMVVWATTLTPVCKEVATGGSTLVGTVLWWYTRQDGRMSVIDQRTSNPGSSLTNDINIDTHRFLARHLALL